MPNSVSTSGLPSSLVHTSTCMFTHRLRTTLGLSHCDHILLQLLTLLLRHTSASAGCCHQNITQNGHTSVPPGGQLHVAHQEDSGADMLSRIALSKVERRKYSQIWRPLRAPRKAQLGCIVRASRQPGVGPQVRGGKVDERQRMVAQEVAAQAQRVEGVVGQQVCAPARVRIMKLHGACVEQKNIAAWLGRADPVSASRFSALHGLLNVFLVPCGQTAAQASRCAAAPSCW